MKREAEAILVVSFGTSFNSSRSITVGGIENVIREDFPEFEIRRAFTSQMIIRHLKKRDGLHIDHVYEALARAGEDGIQKLYMQPTHMMAGHEYHKIQREMARFEHENPGVFQTLVLGEPLLFADADFEQLADILKHWLCGYEDEGTAVVLMGHGSEAKANEVYVQLQQVLRNKGLENYYIGTVEAKPDCGDVLNMLEGKPYTKVVLAPLMIVAGDHANHDMAGEDEDSWKNRFEQAGYDVSCVLEGLGQRYEIGKMFVKKTKKMLNQ